MARPRAPDASSTSTSTVGLPRLSRTSRAAMCSMLDMSAFDPFARRCCRAAAAVLLLWQVLPTLQRCAGPAQRSPRVIGCSATDHAPQTEGVGSRTLLSDMTIRVGPDTIQRILDAGDALPLQVQHPSDLGAAIG